MKRRMLAILPVLLSLSMSEPTSLPPELRNLKVKVLDSKGVVHELTSLKCNEGGNLKLKRGSLDYTLPFTDVQKIKVLEVSGGEVKVELLLKDGKRETFEMPSSTRCTAVSDVGNVNFYISEIRSIEVEGEQK